MGHLLLAGNQRSVAGDTRDLVLVACSTCGRSLIVRWPYRARRLPVIQQVTAYDCGAACLAMLLHGLGRKTSLSECSARFGTGRGGISARELIAAAKSFGL